MPQFSLRQLLLSLIVLAAGCAVLAQAVQGEVLPLGLIAGVFSIGLFFCLLWVLAAWVWVAGLCLRVSLAASDDAPDVTSAASRSSSVVERESP